MKETMDTQEPQRRKDLPQTPEARQAALDRAIEAYNDLYTTGAIDYERLQELVYELTQEVNNNQEVIALGQGILEMLVRLTEEKKAQ